MIILILVRKIAHKSIFERVVKKYNPEFAFAYGSGVFRQKGYSDKDKPMVDFLFGVGSAFDWHKNNLIKNAEDYSLTARTFGTGFVNYLHDKGAKVYYNAFVKLDNHEIKYGVISIKDLIGDLQKWKHLYVAGRLHKPVKVVKSTLLLNRAIETNLNHAVNTALFCLPEKFAEQEFYESIAGISYLGDSRMKNYENPDKVKNIVCKNFEEFKNLYCNVIKSNKNIVSLNEGGMQQDINPLNTELTFSDLPLNLRNQVYKPSFTNRTKLSEEIKKGIMGIVNSSSKQQTFKGFLTAGLWKSLRYVKEKRRKAEGIDYHKT